MGSLDLSKVSLREFCMADATTVLEWAGDDHVTRFTTWDAYQSIKKAEEFIEEMALTHPWCRAICYEGKPIGSMTFTPGAGVNCCRAELGYVLARRYWGKGVTTEAVKLAIPCVFRDLQVHRIDALVYPENLASQRVLEKAGFVREVLLPKYIMVKGNVRDCILFRYLLPDSQ